MECFGTHSVRSERTFNPLFGPSMPRPPQKPQPGKPAPRKKKPMGRDGAKSAKGRKRPATAQSRVNFEQSGERLQKILASAGIASRREAEQLIVEGRVQIDGKIITELGFRADPAQQEIRIDGEPLPHPKPEYYAVHKPTGVVSTSRDPAGRPRVTDMLPPTAGRVFCVGRLDLTSEGLILVTNDGALANQLTHPRHGVEKTYEVQVAGAPEADVLEQLRRGVHLAEGFCRPVNVKIKSRRKGSTLLEMVLDEGRNREIRRVLARVGHKVQRLTRIAVGPVRLGELPRGAVRKLTPEELRKLQAYVKTAATRKADKEADPSATTGPRKRSAAAGKARATGPRPSRGKGIPKGKGKPPRKPGKRKPGGKR
jgi:23S rRNA pseudouridine2605 synthase